MNTAFLAVFIVLQVFDIWTTLVALKKGAREANPVLAWLFSHAEPIVVLIGIKLLATWLLWYVDLYLLTGLFCAFYLWVVDNNLRVIQDKK
jgi:hypothetical protein